MKSQLDLPQYFPYINNKQLPQTNLHQQKILKLNRPDSCLTPKIQKLIKFPSNIIPRTKTSILIDNIVVATKKGYKQLKEKYPKERNNKQIKCNTDVYRAEIQCIDR